MDSSRWATYVVLFVALFASTAAGTAPSFSQAVAERIVIQPTIARQRPAGTLDRFASKSVFGSGQPRGEVYFDLAIRMTDGTMYNPATQREDKVRLRAYRDKNEVSVPDIPFVAPTIQIAPGMTFRVTLNNELPPDTANCPLSSGDPNSPHCFNSTNLHTHGLWISPTGNSDNVLLRINPGITFQYEYNIPPDHPAGTFWYHPHLHGSTALQVSSGMGGALIIKGDRLPTAISHGDIDTLLANSGDGTPFRDRLVLFQQVQYACFSADGSIKQTSDGRYICDPDDIGGIETYDQFGPGTWPASVRYTSINGAVQPTFVDAQTGKPERWRLIHAGVRDSIRVQFRKLRDNAQRLEASNAAPEEWIAENCTGDLLPEFTIANDGLTRKVAAELDTTVLQPGYRADLLMVFPQQGEYCIIDEAAPPEASTNFTIRGRRLLGIVRVEPGTDIVGNIRDHLVGELVAAAQRTMPAGVQPTIIGDLEKGFALSSFTPHPPVADNEITGKRDLEMRIAISSSGVGFQINGQSYDPGRIDQLLALGSAEEWTLTSGTNPPVGHPFHIHVNPFEIVAIKDKDGDDVSEGGEESDSQYAGMKGTWKDTIFVKSGYHVIMRTRYQRYIGEFVLHCHILDHEDQGMMQNVKIGIPDGAGGIAEGHH